MRRASARDLNQGSPEHEARLVPTLPRCYLYKPSEPISLTCRQVCYSKFYVLLKKYICVLCMVPRANSDCFQTQHYIISFRLSYRSGDHLQSHCDPVSVTKLSPLTDSVVKQTTGLSQYSVQRNPNFANCPTLCPISEQDGFCSPPLRLLQQPAMRLKKTPVRTTSRDTHPVLIRDALLIFLTPRRKHT